MKHIFLLFTAITFIASAIAQTIGSKVSIVAVDGKTYSGIIKEIQGNKYNVKYEGYDFESWLTSNQFTIVDGDGATPAIQQNKANSKKVAENYGAEPRNGRYTIRSYGGNIYNPIILGYFDLNNGKYKYYDAGVNLISTGTYSYDEANKQIIWLSGELKKYNSTAAFEISREGKTHSIQLKRGTHASNSTDSK